MADIRSTYSEQLDFFGPQGPRRLAETFGTPLYVYNESVLRSRCRELKGLSAHPGFGVNYSVKANANPALLRIIKDEGLVVDAMSPGELHLDLACGFGPEQILYISNNNSREEMQGAVDRGVLLSVDSLAQLDTYGAVNPGGSVMVRLNPGIGAGHDSKVVTAGSETKFGISPEAIDDVLALLQRHGLTLAGVNQHIGSLFMESESYVEAVQVLLDIVRGLPPDRFATLRVIDFGGGFGIPYKKYEGEARLDMADLGRKLHERITAWSAATGYGGRFLVEPGRYVVAECGILLGRVQAVKSNGSTRYVGTDIGFNVLARPVLYDSFHDIEIYAGSSAPRETIPQTVVGNICESGDILARDRLLPAIVQGDVLGVLDAGAYGFSMASNYNQRLLPAEVLVGLDGAPRIVRRRQTIQDMLACCETV
ncbi:MAG: diaminopimelate decarboxylase [Desulfovibrio sp.]|jgi:diaminopimelate decarboxylase|nr:diaminopimelate decarboxylase [Desulfovibrio sp.]